MNQTEAQKDIKNRELNAQKTKQAQKRREKRAATKAAFIARTGFPPSPSPSTSSSSDVLVRPDPSDPLDSLAKPKQDAPIVGFHGICCPSFGARTVRLR
jgi:hypothetical protein